MKQLYCQAPGPGPGPCMVLPWSYHGLVLFLVKTGPGVDTIIKKPTCHPTTNIFDALVALLVWVGLPPPLQGRMRGVVG